MQFTLSTVFLLLAKTTVGFLLPGPPGKYNITLTTASLVDYSRNDPYAAKPTPRALMLSLFQPTTCESTVPVPYMPEKTAKYQGPYLQKLFNVSVDVTPLFLEARLPVCPDEPDGCSKLHDGPILLFSPGYAIPRFYYNALASAIASEGFTVILIDHPEDANIIVYPDGNTVYNNASIWNDSPDKDVYPRAADASFVIDQLGNATAIAELLPHGGHRPFSTDRVAMMGHSLGGAASIIAASRDRRLRGAINWDGTLFGSLPPSGLSQPVLFMAEENASSPDWQASWPHLKGPKLWVEVANTTHQTFSDLPTLLQAAGQDSAVFADLLGKIAPAEMVRVLAAYTTAWMNAAFTGRERGPLLHGQKPGKFPEVSIVRKGNF